MEMDHPDSERGQQNLFLGDAQAAYTDSHDSLIQIHDFYPRSDPSVFASNPLEQHGFITKSIRPYTTEQSPPERSTVLDSPEFSRKLQALVTQLPDLSALQLLGTLSEYFTKYVLPVMVEKDSAGNKKWKKYFINVIMDKQEEFKNVVIALREIFRYLVGRHYKEMLNCRSTEMVKILCKSVECIIVLTNLSRDFVKILTSKFPECGLKLSLIGEIRKDMTILVRRFVTSENVRDFVNNTKGTKHFVKKRITQVLNQPNRIQQTNAFSPFSSWCPLWPRLKSVKNSQELLKHFDGQCSICFDDVNDDEAIAITDGCSHAFCVPCMETLACCDRHSQWRCPHCRKKYTGWTTKKVFEDHLRRGWKPAQTGGGEGQLLYQAESVVTRRPVTDSEGPLALMVQLLLQDSVADRGFGEANTWNRPHQQNSIADTGSGGNNTWERLPLPSSVANRESVEVNIWDQIPLQNSVVSRASAEENMWDGLFLQDSVVNRGSGEDNLWERLHLQNPLATSGSGGDNIWDRLPIQNSVTNRGFGHDNTWDPIVESISHQAQQAHISDGHLHHDFYTPYENYSLGHFDATDENHRNNDSNTPGAEHDVCSNISLEDNIPDENQSSLAFNMQNENRQHDDEFGGSDDNENNDEEDFEVAYNDNNDEDGFEVADDNDNNDEDNFDVSSESEDYENDEIDEINQSEDHDSDDSDASDESEDYDNDDNDESYEGLITEIRWINQLNTYTDWIDNEIRNHVSYEASADSTST